MSDKPICYDLYCGLGGWAKGFLDEGYECIGFDIEAHDYGTGGYPGELRLRDVRSIHGSELKDAACIVGSSPCQEFSYWHQFSWKAPTPKLGIDLFNSQFRIQREASEAAGRHIPMVVENVVGAQRWVGQAVFHYGSFYFWGDIPALMPWGTAIKGFKKDMKQTPFSRFSSKSVERKMASAMIAKIPFPLANHIAKCFKSQTGE